MSEFHLFLAGFEARTATDENLESRVKRFLESEPNTESLDGPAFAQLNKAEPKADYLLGRRSFVAELKTLNGDPTDRIEQRMKARMAQPGAPIVFGQMGLGPVLKNMPDRDVVSKMLVDLPTRALRRDLLQAQGQIAATKARFGMDLAAGVVVLMNDSQPLIDAPSIGYAIKATLETAKGGHPAIAYAWASIEAHRITLPDGKEGYPQLLVARRNRPDELRFLGGMLEAWAAFNGSELQVVPHNGNWDAMRPIFDGGPPSLSLY